MCSTSQGSAEVRDLPPKAWQRGQQTAKQGQKGALQRRMQGTELHTPRVWTVCLVGVRLYSKHQQTKPTETPGLLELKFHGETDSKQNP